MTEKLPTDVLGLIFRYAILQELTEYDTCPWCRRPYFFILAGNEAVAIRSVCRRWRDVFLHKVLLPGVAGARNHSVYCLTPETCIEACHQRLVVRVSMIRPIFHVVRLNVINYELDHYNSDSDSSFIDDESITEDSDEFQLAEYWEEQWAYHADTVE